MCVCVGRREKRKRERERARAVHHPFGPATVPSPIWSIQGACGKYSAPKEFSPALPCARPATECAFPTGIARADYGGVKWEWSLKNRTRRSLDKKDESVSRSFGLSGANPPPAAPLVRAANYPFASWSHTRRRFKFYFRPGHKYIHNQQTGWLGAVNY